MGLTVQRMTPAQSTETGSRVGAQPGCVVLQRCSARCVRAPAAARINTGRQLPSGHPVALARPKSHVQLRVPRVASTARHASCGPVGPVKTRGWVTTRMQLGEHAIW